MKKYRAFLSYSHADERRASWIHRRLEKYRIPPDVVEAYQLPSSRLKPIFRDRDELSSSADLGLEITSALTQSDSLIVICSEAASKSHWVDEEVRAFIEMGRANEIHCLIVDGEAPHVFPKSLLATGREPLAADSRKDGRKSALLKLISGLLNVDFDELQKRESRSKRKQTLLVGSALLFSMVITSVLFTSLAPVAMVIASVIAVYALIQRNTSLENEVLAETNRKEAEGQRADALEARDEAETQRELAEEEARTAKQVTDFLVDLFESSDPFTESQGDFTVRKLLDRGAEKIEHGLASEPRLRARLLATIGQVHTQLGLFEEARRFLDDALATQHSILDSDDPQILHTQSRRAWLATQTGNYEQAQRIYDAILPTLGEGLLYSDVLAHTREWAELLNDLGVLQWSANDLKSAKSTLAQALAMGEESCGTEHAEIAPTLNNLGLVFAYSQEYEAARPFYERALSIRENIQGADHPCVIPDILNLAATVRSLGEFNDAKMLLERALRIAETSLEPDHPGFADLNNGLGQVLWRQGDYDAALERLEHAGRLYVKAYGETGVGVHYNLQHQARVLHSMGDLQRSKLLYERSADALGEHRHESARELAEVMEALGDIDGALEFHQLANELSSKMFDVTNPYLIEKTKQYEEFLERNGLARQSATRCDEGRTSLSP
jgi:tetratricopeptide (TPR) repeat protein